MSKPKRVSEVAELEAMIDRLEGLKQRRKERAEALDKKADTYFQTYGKEIEILEKEPNIKRRQLCDRQLEKARKWREKARRLRNFKSTEERLHHFGQKLAELKTTPIPGFLPDNSVSV